MLELIDNFAPCVLCGFTTREGGVSEAPYSSFNLGDHVGDAPQAVSDNRALLEQSLGCKVRYMRQVHGSTVVTVGAQDEGVPQADAQITTCPDLALAVLTADCLPLLMCSGNQAVAAVHCGWRSLRGGIVNNALAVLRALSAAPIKACLGPCIGPQSFVVGPEIREAFAAQDSALTRFFQAGRGDRLLCDLRGICRYQLERGGVSDIIQSEADTFAEPNLYYSYRREGVTGRLAGVIALR